MVNQSFEKNSELETNHFEDPQVMARLMWHQFKRMQPELNGKNSSFVKYTANDSCPGECFKNIDIERQIKGITLEIDPTPYRCENMELFELEAPECGSLRQ